MVRIRNIREGKQLWETSEKWNMDIEKKKRVRFAA